MYPHEILIPKTSHSKKWLVFLRKKLKSESDAAYII